MRILFLALALAVAAPAAFPAPPASRAEALAALRSEDAAARAEALVWIANRGEASDEDLLHERLRDESALVRRYAEQALWLLWGRSGDPALDRLMARGVDEMHAGSHAAAIATFSSVIARKPDFAEGWNKRATVYYLAGEYQKSLADCDEVIRRKPRHFGALSGAGLIHAALEQLEEAQRWFRRALEVNPNLIGIEIELRTLEERLKRKRGLST